VVVDANRLENFLSLAEHGHFTRAAEARQVAQSGLSASVRALEGELGVKLVERSTRRVELTAAGRAFVPEAEAVLEAMRRARAAAVAGAQGVRGTLRIGILYGLTPAAVMAGISSFLREHEQVEAHLAGPGARGSATHLDEVRAGRLDFAVVMTIAPAPGIRLHALTSDTITLACPADNLPMLVDGAVDLGDIPLERVIDFPAGWGVRSAIDRSFAAAGIVNRVSRMEMNDLSTVLDLVRHGLGYAFVPASLEDDNPDIRFVRIRGARPELQICIATGERFSSNPLAVRLVSYLLGR
jgi:DNA-binding transcriptional LysR family regulator